MEQEEAEKVLNQIKQQLKEKYKDKTDEEIEQAMLESFFEAYANNKMTRDDLVGLAAIMGYEANDEVLDQFEKERREAK